MVNCILNNNSPKYIRLDGKPLPPIYNDTKHFDFDKGFSYVTKGETICIISTGYMTHTAQKVINYFREKKKNIGLIDVFLLNHLDEQSLSDIISNYKIILTLEEAFINRGGLDTYILSIINKHNLSDKLYNFGIDDKYIFEIGQREHLHKLNKIDAKNIILFLEGLLSNL